MIGVANTIGALIVALHGGGQQDSAMTLDQAIKVAESNAFAIRIQRSAIEKNHQKINELVGGYGPQVSIGGTYLRYDKALTASFGAGSPPIVIQPIDAKNATATLTLPIDLAGNHSRQVRATEAIRRASQNTLNATFSDTKLNVKQNYLGVLKAKAQIVVFQTALNDAKERLSEGQKKFEQQQVAKLDVTRYQAQVAQSTSDLIAAQDNLTLANYAFNASLARPIETPVNIVDIPELPSVEGADDQFVEAAKQFRPEIRASTENLKALTLVRQAVQAGMAPTLNLQVQYQRSIDAQGFSSRDQSTTGTLVLSVPIFDSGVTRAKTREAREDEQQARIGLEQTTLGISQEVRNALANLASAKARYASATEQVKLAEEVFRLAKVKQDAGAGTYYEVIDAEAQLTQARNGQVSARYDCLTSYSQLQRAVGKDDLAAALNSSTKGGK